MNPQEFLYVLPPEKIALYPLAQRDHSKLLVYRNGNIDHAAFHQLTDFLPSNSFLFFNDTRVIPARLLFTKDTGADIEIFLLNPLKPSSLISEAMAAQTECTWQCTIGNLKRWTEGLTLFKQIGNITLEARLADREMGHVNFYWSHEISFAEIVNLAGETPLPPYLKRKAESNDRTRYQTIYSHHEGAVAAPTAGLHFTEDVFASMKRKNILHDFLTLHVSAGTFQPIKAENAEDHIMHHEQIVVTRKNIENLLDKNHFIVPVGTTSMRTLESIYWFGVRLLKDKGSSFHIDQYEPYAQTETPPKEEALRAVLAHMHEKKTESVIGETSIFIKPGYAFRICDALITNFHQPASTLILLVAAFVGHDWTKIYNEALEKDYRFLSYGDSSLLMPKMPSHPR